MAARKKAATPKKPDLFKYIPESVVAGMVQDRVKETIEREINYSIEDIIMDGVYDQIDSAAAAVCTTKEFKAKIKVAVTAQAIAAIKNGSVYVDVNC